MKNYYEISGFRFNEVFATEAEALKRFEEVKHNFTYCEVKKVEQTDKYYRAESIKIFYK